MSYRKLSFEYRNTAYTRSCLKCKSRIYSLPQLFRYDIMRITANLFECAKISNGLKLFANSLQCHHRLQIMQLCNEPTYKCVTCMHTIVYRLDLSMKGHNVLTYSCQVPFSSLVRKLTMIGTDSISYILFFI